MRIIYLLIISGLLFSSNGCLSIGKQFSVSMVSQIEIGKTTQPQINKMFGKPWRVGIEDGQHTWTYAHYQYSIFSKAKTFDLVIKFSDQNIVSSYTFNTTDPSVLEK